METSASRSCHQLVTWVVSALGFVAQQVLTIVLLGTSPRSTLEGWGQTRGRLEAE
jgi:hypothetical protein